MNHFKIASKIGCWFCLTFHETEKIWITWISESSEPEFNSKTHFNQLFLQFLVERWLSEACSRIPLEKIFPQILRNGLENVYQSSFGKLHSTNDIFLKHQQLSYILHSTTLNSITFFIVIVPKPTLISFL